MALNDNICVLPEEIRDEILLRLPAKSIGRCRCLSKSWRSLPSHPDFIQKHIHSVGKFQGVSFGDAHRLFDEMTVRPNKLIFPNYPDNYWSNVLASCDGLVLVGTMNNENLSVINSFTQHIRELPAVAVNSLASVYGLGYDSIPDDYIVGIISYEIFDEEDEPVMLVDVYSLKNDTWEEFECAPFDPAVKWNRMWVFVNGCIHWLGSNTIDKSSVIVGFDLADTCNF